MEALNNLKIMKKLFDDEGIHYWLDAGTLLCAYRDGDLECEHDTDVGVFVENFPKIKKLENKLNELYQNTIGMFILKETYPIYTAWGSGSLLHNVIHGDIIYWHPLQVLINNKPQNYRYCYGVSLPFSLPSQLLSNFSTISFKIDTDNTQFTIPGSNNKETEEYLEYYFGKDWKTKMTSKEYQDYQNKVITNEIKPYPINTPIQEVIEFKRKMTNVFYCGKSHIDKISKIKKYKPHGKVLDYGCGIGNWIEIFNDNGYDYVGVDQSKDKLNKAKKYNPHGNFMHITSSNMSFNNEFDIVQVSISLQQNVPKEQEKIIQKIHQALNTNGILVITENTLSNENKKQQWISSIEKCGFKFMESWHKNESIIDDTCLFIKIDNSNITHTTHVTCTYQLIKTLTIETSTFCNAECIICPNSNHRREPHLMSLENFENTLNLFPNLSSISLCGCYEPLSDDRLPEIFDIIKKTHPNIEITIFSNGSLLDKWIDLILSTKNLSSIIFSVHGYSNNSYNKITKNLDRNTVYNNIIKLINRRNELGNPNPKISVTSLRLSSNIHELEEFKNFWKQQKIDYVHMFELMNWNNKVDNYDNLIEKPKLTSRPCPMYEFPMVIDAHCNVVRCCYNISFSYGNVFTNGVNNYLLKKRISTTYPDWDCIKCDGWKI